jgi:hypothetical protein
LASQALHQSSTAMAATLKSPVEQLHQRLEVFSKKTVTLKFKPPFFSELLAPLKHFDKQWNDVVVTIASMGLSLISITERLEALQFDAYRRHRPS